MRWTLPTAAALLLAFGSNALAAAPTVVQIDQAVRLNVAGAAATVFVGNPTIADVAVVNHNTIVVTGKGFGRTNVMVMDARGRTIMDRQVQVSAGGDGHVTVYRATTAGSYTCSPNCEQLPVAAAAPAPVLK